MGKLMVSFLLLLVISTSARAQLSDNFDDGDFLTNPEWTGTADGFIINNNFQLQSEHSIANTSFYLSTPNTTALEAEWEFFIQLNFNPSSANYIDVYLTASGADLTAPGITGYFVRLGNASDEISLYRKDAGSIVKIIDGIDGLLNKSNNVLKIKVTRSSTNKWSLYRDLSGTGNSFQSEGFVEDATYQSSAAFGLVITQSTASFFQKHFFDDIIIKNYVPDITPPDILSATAISESAVDVLFNEPVEAESALLFSNYAASGGLGMPVSVIVNPGNAALIHLTFDKPFINGHVYTLNVSRIKDFSGNNSGNINQTFSYYVPQQYDVVIHELFADASPQVGLPNSEWIELKNTSDFPVNLKGWRVGDASGISGPMPDILIPPGAMVIVCAVGSVAALTPFGTVISVTSFPSLDNTGELLFIIDAKGKTIHAVEYSIDWYQNELKKEGGWSLEMVDAKNPCSGASNWKASTHIDGGTPGKSNSVTGINPDETKPALLRAFAQNETTVSLVFNEPLDSLKAVGGSYVIDNGLTLTSVIAEGPLFNRIHITLSTPISRGKIYPLEVRNITDCSGNVIGEKNKASFGIAEPADSSDLVINEILFNPPPNGVDYVEIYNRSSKIIEVNKLYLANRNSSNNISSVQQLSVDNRLLFPGEFLLLTTDISVVKSQFITLNPDALVQVNSLPSYPNDNGNVILLNSQGDIIDEVSYSDKWHFELITNSKGVALERISYDGPSAKNNFHSAATSAGYGTPGYKNSQHLITETIKGEIKITPEIFSPDNDGIDDLLTINYQFPTPGYVTNITIFDATGKPIRFLEKNSLSGLSGYYRWDGLDDKRRKLPQGMYIIFTEVFNKEGKKKFFKNTVVLARRF